MPWQGWIHQLETAGIGFHFAVCPMKICDFATYRVSFFEFLILSLNDDILEHSCEEQLALGSDEKHKENLVASDPEITLHLLQRGVTWPAGLQSLTFGGEFNQSLDSDMASGPSAIDFY